MYAKIILIITFLSSIQFCLAQNKITISGYIKDSNSGEAISSASVSIQNNQGVLSNSYGFFAITVPQGQQTLGISVIGYLQETVSFLAARDTLITIQLHPQETILEEVVITRSNNDKAGRLNMGIEKLSMATITKLPVIAGEKDIIKSLQLMPGVKSAGEAGSGFFVRGGTADQNLILLDEAPVYNPSHMLGFFSVFNTDATKDATLYKGNIPAMYGGRSSAVLDVSMKEGNNQKMAVEGGVGLIASRLSVETPIKKNRGSVILSGRRTYADLFLGLVDEEPMKSSKLYFYDLNLKANYSLGEKDKMYASGYFGKDRFKLGTMFNVDWSNATGTLRWNHLFGEKLFSNTSLIYSNYNYQITNEAGGNNMYNTSTIQDFNLKNDFTYYAGNNATVRFGFNSVYHHTRPGVVSSDLGGKATTLDLDRNALENALYYSHEFSWGQKFNLELGARFSSFSLLGKGDYYDFDRDGNITDTTSYHSGDFIKSWFNIEPRIGLSYLLNTERSVKASFSRAIQNMHLLTNGSLSMPSDIWMPNTLHIKPQYSDQVALGYFQYINDRTYEFSIEGYYKQMHHVIDYKDGAKVDFNPTVETELLIGHGRAYGVELLLRKRTGKLTGWLGYTLSRVENKIPGINNGDYYPARQDRTHEITLVGMYELSKKWTLSGSWIYYTGNAITFPGSKYLLDHMTVNHYSARNAYRMPGYHRMDLSMTWQRKKTVKFESSWNFGIYNVYGRENPYFITFRQSAQDPMRTEVVQTSLFRFIPTIMYNFKF